MLSARHGLPMKRNFILDVGAVKRVAAEFAELAGLIPGLLRQSLARRIVLRNDPKLFHERQRLHVDGRMVANHRLRERTHNLVVRFGKRLLARVHIKLAGRISNVSDLGVAGMGRFLGDGETRISSKAEAPQRTSLLIMMVSCLVLEWQPFDADRSARFPGI